MALNSRNFFISTILVFITFSFLIDKFQDTTSNRFLFETSSQSQEAIELFEKYFKQEQEQPSMELVSAHVYTSAVLPEVFYEIFSDDFVDQYWENIATASHEPAPVIF
ncbi:18992_t:CDS:1 [Funneliformis geosporum]|uniref:16714_t:CDS:1 n=1 Tax=Funneliformis geosporum TaxID=1117311 RepID=A0A9W4ST87_9GLOM|nr:18992_t:CDS:1 [Funneliformis geosporum]CAI2180042.1 16714_t:CDS:1 [Funneliformis geosporum]